MRSRDVFAVLCCMFCIFGQPNVHAQKRASDANGFPLADIARDAINMLFSIPEGFRFLNIIESPTIHRNAYPGGSSFVFESEDSQCRLYWPILPTGFFPYDPGDLPVYDDDNLSHRNLIWYDLTRIMQTDDFNFNDYVTVASGREARRRFHADSVFMYDVPKFVPVKENEAQFEYCTRMIIICKDRGGILPFVWHFTPEGKKREQDYIRKLDGRVWYGRKRRLELLNPEIFQYVDEFKQYQRHP